MIDDRTVSRHETGVTRVFALNLPEERISPFREGDADRIAAALGVDQVDHDHVEVVRVEDLQPIGLSEYLAEGYGVPEEALSEDKGRLDTLEGHVLLVRSQAFGGADTRISPAEDVTLIGAYREPSASPSFEPIRSDGATGTLSPARAAEHAAGRKVSAGWMVLIGVVLAILLVLLLT